MNLLDLVFPPRCVACGDRGAWLCPRCVDAMPRISRPRCARCAIPVTQATLCQNCERRPPEFDSLVCEFLFEGTARIAIHQLKYKRAQHLARSLVAALVAVSSDLPVGDIIVPVPLHLTRKHARGYNQSTLIARALSMRLEIGLAEPGLVRVRDSPTQVSLPAAQRWANVRDSFAAEPGIVSRKSVVLVDDVATTTSTLRAAASALRRAGAIRVDAVVIARAVAATLPDRGTVDAPSPT